MQLSREHLTRGRDGNLRAHRRSAAKGGEPATCAALCRRLNRAIDDKVAALTNAGAAIACAAGCDYCCHLRVEVFPHEAVALHDHLRTRLSPAERRSSSNGFAPTRSASTVDGRAAPSRRHALCLPRREGVAALTRRARRLARRTTRLSRERCEHAFRHPADIGTSAWLATRVARAAGVRLRADRGDAGRLQSRRT